MKPPPDKPKAGPVKRLLQNLALSCVTFLLCIAGLEIVLRLAGYGNLEIYQPDPALYWRLKPNQDCYTKIDRKPVHINAHGTRGPEFTDAKPDGTLRILSLGDSRTFGWGLTAEESYSGRLQSLLQERLGAGRRVEVINAGVNAWSYAQMLVYLREYGLKFQPDLVILAEANLWTQFSEQNSPEFVRQFMGRVRLKNFLRHFAIYHYFIEVKLKDFYERNRTKFIPVDPSRDEMFRAQQQKNPEQVFSNSVWQICQLAATNRIPPVLLYLPTLGEIDSTNRPMILEVKRGVSAALGVPLVDLTAEVKAGGKSLYLDADPVHLNSLGNERIADKLFQTVTNCLK